MLVLQSAYRIVFFLFFLTCTPLNIHSDNYQQSDCVNTGVGLIKEGVISKNIKRKNNTSDNSKLQKSRKHTKLSYYLYVKDFIKSFIDIPTNPVLVNTSTISSKYLAGRSSVYNKKGKKAGTCSASFLCIQNANGIYTDIANYLSVNNGLIITWFTPTTLINLELDSIVNSMVTECIVIASTKVGFNPYYGKKFNMVVSSNGKKVFFKLSEIPNK